MRKNLVIVLLISLFFICIDNVKAWHATNITLSNIEINNNDMASFDISFDLPVGYGSATSWVFLQTGEFVDGDFTDFGHINRTYLFSNLDSVKNNTEFMNTYGIKGITPDNNNGFRSFGSNTHIEQSLSVTGLPLDEVKDYNVYLWTYNGFHIYPDEYLGKLTFDGNGNFDIIDSIGEMGTIIGYHKVYFETNSDTEIINQTIENNTTINVPEDPKKEGFTFEGWYTDSDLTEEFDVNTPILDETILYAKWNKIYNIIGDNLKTYILNSYKDIVFKADGELDNLFGIKIDGELLDSKNYKTESGSTILTLFGKYLNSLSTGNHIVTFVYNDGIVDTTIKVETEKQKQSTNKVIESKNDSIVENPNTKDSVFTYIALFGLSFGAIVSLKLIDKKRKTN